MSGSASATPSPGSTEQQTSWSARPCSGAGSSDPRNKKVMLFEAEVCCAMKTYLGAKQQKRRHAIRFTFHHENTNVIPKRKCLWCKNWRDIVVFTLRGATFSWQQTKLSLVRIGPNPLYWSHFRLLHTIRFLSGWKKSTAVVVREELAREQYITCDNLIVWFFYCRSFSVVSLLLWSIQGLGERRKTIFQWI